MNTRKQRVSRYPDYRSCDSQWLGTLPAHWALKRLKSCAMDVADLTSHRKGNDVYVALEHVESWTGRIIEAEADPTFENQVKRFQPGDILFGKLRPYLAKVTQPKRSGVCVGEFLVLRSREGVLVPSYLERLMRSKPMIDLVDSSTFGAKMPRADWHFIGNMAIPLPTPEEQAAIVRSLDHTDELINRYISAKERLIALLEEQRQAVIHQTVTQGVDPHVPMRPAKMDWIGDVPQHWKKRRLKEIAAIQTGITIGPDNGHPGLFERPYMRVANVQADHLDLSQVTKIRVSPAEIKRSTLQVGDVLMTEGGDIDKLGRGCIWQGEIPGCLHQNHVFAVRPDPALLNPEFLVAVMGSVHGRTYFYLTAKQTTNLAATNRTTLGNLPIYLPSASEQLNILNHIENKRDAVDNAINQARQQINLMNEYRTRLIADAVTGQIDVRNATASVPEP